jgi:serine/threonine protein phosphatase PrpC
MAVRNEYFSGVTDTGKMRDNNEDAFIAQSIWNGRYVAGCVIDGVGGYEGGEVAAQLAKEAILQQLQSRAEDLTGLLKKAVVLANQKIYSEKETTGKNSSMACVLTIAVADIDNNQFFYAHVGDTRLYLLRDHSLVKVTHDHSFVGFLEDSKRLSETEAMRHPKRNEINKALGFDPNIASAADYIETGVSPFLPGDMLLICSDGLSDMIDSKKMTEVLTSSQSISQKAKELITAANHAGGKDNITVVLIENTKKPVEQEATKPVLIKKNESHGENRKEEKIEKAKSRPPKTYGGLAAFLFITTLVLGVALYWLWQNRNAAKIETQDPLPVVPAKQLNAGEQKLMDSINAGAFIFWNDSTVKELTITDTIRVQKDSLYINGNGLILKSDSAFSGPAFIFSPQCKYAVLENITFAGFAVGIVAESKVLHLKNVRFQQCAVPVQYRFLLPPNLFINGVVGDTISFRSDSLPKLNMK